MRYFTRQLHNQDQDDIGIQETDYEREQRLQVTAHEWELVNRKYFDYIARLRGTLPVALENLVELCLHDAVVMSARRAGDSAEINLDPLHAPFMSNKSLMRLHFSGIVFESGLAEANGQGLLYEELFVCVPFYEFSALLEKTEFVVRFQQLQIDVVAPE